MIDSSIEYLKGVGPQRASIINEELGIKTLEDLLYFFPYRYIDRTNFHKINQINSTNLDIQIVGTVKSIKEEGFGRKKRLIVLFYDEESEINLIFFKRILWIKKFLEISKKYIVFGKPNLFNGVYSFVHPEMELVENLNTDFSTSFQPMYSSTEKLKSNNIQTKLIKKIIRTALDKLRGKILENFSLDIINKYKLISRSEAINNIHFPESKEKLNQAIFRMKFEELFFLQLSILSNKSVNKKIKSYLFKKIGNKFNSFFKSLPFELTEAQKKVIRDVRKDVLSGYKMNRLIQGDVGSGKTVVALMSLMMCVDNGYQGVLMVPTSVLASQHFRTLLTICKDLELNISLLTGATKKSDRKKILSNLENGLTDIIIGTHALIEDSVVFNNLGLVVIDEQHKFGVAQRAKLSKKSILDPHVIVLTATPIPRTLAMTFYGDLDVSVINELPPGRKEIKTVHKFDKDKEGVLSFLREKIELGQQVYVIYPLIEESEKLDYKNLFSGYNFLSNYFSRFGFVVSMLHGNMKVDEKTQHMEDFLNKKSQILVSTTVIEVGLDVKNASIMLIENAERFGLAQLHQLRGRVGRGNTQSYCILKTPYKLSHEAKYRINVLVESSNGFDISEADLKLRGPGDIMGTRQSGLLNLKISNLVKDTGILVEARKSANKLLEFDKELINPKNKMIKKYFIKNYSEQIKWARIS